MYAVYMVTGRQIKGLDPTELNVSLKKAYRTNNTPDVQR